MQKIRLYADERDMTEEQIALRRAVTAPERLAMTPMEETIAVHDGGRYRLDTLSRKERRQKVRASKAKGSGFTKKSGSKRKRKKK